MREAVLFLMVLAYGAMWPGGGAMAADVGFMPYQPARPLGTTLTCDDVITDAEKALVLAYIADPPTTSERRLPPNGFFEEGMISHIAPSPDTGSGNSPPIVFGLSITVSSLTENTVFCGALVYDLNLDNEFSIFAEKKPVKGELKWHRNYDNIRPYFDRICSVIKFNETDVLRCYKKVVFEPNTDPEKGPVFDGSDSYRYVAADGDAGSNYAEVTITYKPAKKPISADDFVETKIGVPITIDVLANDTDPEGGRLSIDSVMEGLGRVVINEGKTITYTLVRRAVIDLDQFDYMVINDAGRYSTSTVTVTIIPEPEPEPELPAPPSSPPWWKWWK